MHVYTVIKIGADPKYVSREGLGSFSRVPMTKAEAANAALMSGGQVEEWVASKVSTQPAIDPGLPQMELNPEEGD